MTRLSAIAMGLVVFAFTVFGCSTQPSSQSEAGWTTLTLQYGGGGVKFRKVLIKPI